MENNKILTLKKLIPLIEILKEKDYVADILPSKNEEEYIFFAHLDDKNTNIKSLYYITLHFFQYDNYKIIKKTKKRIVLWKENIDLEITMYPYFLFSRNISFSNFFEGFITKIKLFKN
ncbi:MAG: hypothetical protein V4504_00995 [Patescibacteria group bacterium]